MNTHTHLYNWQKLYVGTLIAAAFSIALTVTAVGVFAVETNPLVSWFVARVPHFLHDLGVIDISNPASMSPASVGWGLISMVGICSVPAAFKIFEVAGDLADDWGMRARWTGGLSIFLFHALNAVNDAVTVAVGFDASAGFVWGFRPIVYGAIAATTGIFVFREAGWRPHVPSFAGRPEASEVSAVVLIGLLVLSSAAVPAAAVIDDNSSHDQTLEMETSKSDVVAANPGEKVTEIPGSFSASTPFSKEGEIIYTPGGSATVGAYNLETDSFVWNSSTNSPQATAPAITDELVIAGTQSDEIHAFHKENGTLAWSYTVGADMDSSPQLSDDGSTVVFGSNTNNATALNTADGSVAWKFETGGAIKLSTTIVNGTAYVASQDNTLYALSVSSGNKEWEYTLPDTPGTSPVVHNDSIYIGFGSFSAGTLEAVYKNGTSKWSKNIEVTGTPTVKDGVIYVGDNNGNLNALDTSDGGNIWTKSYTGNVGGATIANGTVYANARDYFVAVDAITGDEKWKNAGDYGSALVSDGVAYAYNNSRSSIVGFATDHAGDSNGARMLHNVEHSLVSASSGGSASTVSVLVRDQNGDPVSNATVEVVGVDYSNIAAGSSQTLNDRANELLDEAKNPLPGSWDADLNLLGSSGPFEADANVVAVHNAEDVAKAPWVDSADLSQPRLRIEAGQEVMLSVWDPTASGPGLLGHEYNSQLPGVHKEEATIVVEQLTPSGEVKRTMRFDTDKTLGAGALDPDRFNYADVSLSRGFYRVSPASSDVSYTIVVGSPSAMAAEITQNLKTEADQLTERAKEIRDRFQNNKFTRKTVTTNASGEFTVSLGSSVKTVSVTAYKTPRGMGPNATRADIREWYNAMLFNPSEQAGSLTGLTVDYQDGFTRSDANLTTEANLSEVVPAFYLPDGATTVDVPTNDTVSVDVFETTVPEYADANITSNRSEWLRDLLANRTQRLDELFSQLNASRERYQELFGQYKNLSAQNEEFRQRVRDLLEARTGNRTINISTNESTEKLRERLDAVHTALSELKNQFEANTTTDVGAETVSATADFPFELSKDALAVRAQLSNGTTRTVSDEYITLDDGVPGVGGTSVRVTDYPLGDAASGQIIFDVVSSEGIGSFRTDAISNPTVSASAPDVPSVRASTMSPTPDERVTITLNPAEDSTFENLTAFSARYVANGTTIANADRLSQRKGAVTPKCACKVQVRLTYTETADNEFVRTFVLRGVERASKQPPSIRAQSDATGVWALVSDGLQAGDVSKTGSGLNYVAVIKQDADAPSSIHAYTAGVSSGANSELDLRIVRGENRETVRTRTSVTFHTESLQDGALAYRGQPASLNPFANDGTPLRDGSKAGSVVTKDSHATIETYTEADGSVTISISNSPGFFESLIWDATALGIPFLMAGFSGATMAGGIVITPVGLLAFLRRRRGDTE